MVVIIFNILLLLTLFINTIKLQQKSERLVYLQHNEAPLRHYTTRPASTSGNTAQIKSVFPKPSSRRTPNGLGLSRTTTWSVRTRSDAILYSLNCLRNVLRANSVSEATTAQRRQDYLGTTIYA